MRVYATTGRTVLHHAVMSSSRRVLQQVLYCQPDHTAVDKEGNTPLMLLQSKRTEGFDKEANELPEDNIDGDYGPWGDDPLKVDYREDDSPIEMLQKYIEAREKAHTGK
jgi:hypothetical protein